MGEIAPLSPVRRQPPTVRLRRLAGELRRLRQEAGLSQAEVTEKTDVNLATLHRIETAKTKPQLRTLNALLDAYGVTGDRRTDLVTLQKEAKQRGWLHGLEAELPGPYSTYIGLEAEAQQAINYESLFIPGLLQTEDYARAVVRGVVPTATDAEVESFVTARMRRQALLDSDTPLRLWAIVDQAALSRTVGSDAIMRAQLAHIVQQAQRPHITVQVIPFSAGAHPGMPGSFIVLKFGADGPDVIHIDSMVGDLFLEKEADIRLYNHICEHLRAIALSPAATAALLASLREDH
ncbi:transcriptional regulator with XRE-family HTH domain [Streptosporangium becharense]|uniref:Transcriptional regulator with XRE-family HTH domain n=1 Tax=Streptosporangium becharense TaxID=1816182 RepID=A0A7W9MIM1_9ACTN|nr:helix-turn-helix transcriptional regulator [Streptosporangium becharense]MBB2911274.1 transcriptional regulator with XRE-family HTH domain [Streptosporangium becharense]MBB5821668.1 transcriptional regulator with XRE-family HTH domain [Streptosporangium becharense]